MATGRKLTEKEKELVEEMNYELVTIRGNVYNFYHNGTFFNVTEFIEVKGNGFITVTDEDEQELYLRASEVISIREM